MKNPQLAVSCSIEDKKEIEQIVVEKSFPSVSSMILFVIKKWIREGKRLE